MAAPFKDEERFDASQYAFFGTDVTQEVELGGLDEEEDNIVLGGTLEDDDRLGILSEKEEVEVLDVVSQSDDFGGDISEISSSYRNLGLGPVHDHEVDHSAINWARNHQLIQDSHGMRAPNFLSQRPWIGAEAGFPQTPPFPIAGSYPPAQMQAPGLHQPAQQQAVTSHGTPPPNYRLHSPGPRSVPVGSTIPQFLKYGGSPVLSPSAPQGQHGQQWMPPPNIQLGVSSGLLQGYIQQHVTQQHTPFQPPTLLQRQPGHSRVTSPNLQQSIYNSMPSTPTFNAGDGRDYRHDLHQQGRRLYQSNKYESGNLSNRGTMRQQFRSKYMSAEEIESIAKIQLAATHINDPYIDDYYHQAAQAKQAGTMHGRRPFAPSNLRDLPSHLRDLPSHRRAPSLQPTFIPVDGLGKVPFSSVRRPRPLLEVEDSSDESGGNTEGSNLKDSERPLEQEPMLAARITIEDGLCLILDVDDIDRYFSTTQTPDGGAQLRRQRYMILESLAALFHLVDPGSLQGNSDSGTRELNDRLMGAETKDDYVFLRLVSLSKGRKLLNRYLRMLPPGSRLVQIVCLAVFRNLRFLFGSVQNDKSAVVVTSELANTVADLAARMDLNALSGCLAAVVLSPELPLLRPLGNPADEGASLVLRSALDRATCLLTDPKFTFPLEERALWQSRFDGFFNLLYKYCTNKFDSILHSVAMSSPPGRSVAVNAIAAGIMSKEMPIELLRSSLPHMNEQQRKSLLDFTQRSIAHGTLSGHNAREGHSVMSPG